MNECFEKIDGIEVVIGPPESLVLSLRRLSAGREDRVVHRAAKVRGQRHTI